MPCRAPALALFSFLLLAGCNAQPIAPVKGRITCAGKAVDRAAIVFAPVQKNEDDLTPGKSATGFSDSDGIYVLSTFKPLDGALIGKHRVTVSLEDSNPARCKRVTLVNLEVVPTDNELNIELKP